MRKLEIAESKHVGLPESGRCAARHISTPMSYWLRMERCARYTSPGANARALGSPLFAQVFGPGVRATFISQHTIAK